MRLLLAALAAGTLLVLAAVPAEAAAARRSCGTVQVFSTPVRIVVLRGVSCATAKRVTRGLHNGGAQSSRGWTCALAHAPFDHVDGREVAFSCGRGAGAGDLRKRPHAFVGTVAAGGGGTPT